MPTDALGSAWNAIVEGLASDADALADGNNAGTAKNAIEHAYSSASLTYDTNAATAKRFGDLKELTASEQDEANDSYKDQWNNEIGRRIGQYARDHNLPKSAIDDIVIDAWKTGKLITDETTDSRVPGNPGYTPSSPDWSAPSGN